MSKKNLKPAIVFILFMGIVSMFSDMTHEGARSIYGAYLSLAGASAAVIGFVTGLGEFIGYSFRLVTGVIADKSKQYWTVAIIGYFINMFAVPAIALATKNSWIIACIFIVLERTGKAIRHPAKNTLVSFAGSQIGDGKSFAIQEFLDQLGAFLGPLILFFILYFRKGLDKFQSYRICFAFLTIPAILTILFLFLAKHKFPNPENFEEEEHKNKEFKFKKSFIIYIIAISFFAFGFLDFPIITMHISKMGIVKPDVLPLLYSGAMLVDAFSALIFGWLYDKIGIKTLIISTAISSLFSLFIFKFNSLKMIILGIVMWGIGMGAEESILKSVVSTIVPKNNRSTGFGIFETSFGIFWFLGSWLMGICYEISINYMIAISIAAQIIAIILFVVTEKTEIV